MTGTWSNRRYQVALGVIALGAFVLRVFPFFGADGAWSYRVDYDEGVYFSAASFLLEGVLPYRDYVFVHPPGLLVFLAATSAWTHTFLGVDGAFALSRWIAAGLGTLNVLLVARLVPRSATGKWGALFGSAFYASYPEIVAVERGPFLEPLLNLVCLCLAAAVVQASVSPRRDRWLWLAGAIGGLAVSVKLWAGIWVLGALWGVSSFAGWREMLKFLGGALGGFGLVVLPFALASPAGFLEQAGLFHLWRPPDGMTDRLSRLEQIFALRHLASPVLATLMAGLLVLRRGPGWTLTTRVLVCAWGLTLAAFFASAGYWSQYNAHLIASEAVLAGALLSWVLARLRPPRAALVVALSSALLVVSVTESVRRAQGNEQHLLLSRSALRRSTDCVFTFEPGWSLAAGRLPPRLEGTPLVVDSYAHQLLGAVRGGQRYPSAEAAFGSSQSPLGVIDQCRSVVLGDRGRRQLSPWLRERLSTTHAPTEVSGLEVWQKNP